MPPHLDRTDARPASAGDAFAPPASLPVRCEALPWLVGGRLVFRVPRLPGARARRSWRSILFALSVDLVLGYAGHRHAWTRRLSSGRGPIRRVILAAQTAGASRLRGLLARGGSWRRCIGPRLTVRDRAADHGPDAADADAGRRRHALRSSGQQGSDRWTGGADGLQGMEVWPIFGAVPLRPVRRDGLFLLPGSCYLAALARSSGTIVYSAFGRSLTGIRENVARMRAIGAPVEPPPADGVRTFAAGARGDLRALSSAQTTQFVGLGVLSLERSGTVLIMLIIGGVGQLYGAFIGVPALHGRAGSLRDASIPVYWYFWIGLFMVLRRSCSPGAVRSASWGRSRAPPRSVLWSAHAHECSSIWRHRRSVQERSARYAVAQQHQLPARTRRAARADRARTARGRRPFVNLVTGALHTDVRGASCSAGEEISQPARKPRRV